jgi:hypothetical protein
MALCCKIVTTVGFFIVAFFFSLVMNQMVHALFPPSVADYVNDFASAVQIILILYATGFMDCIHKKKY